MGTHFILFKCSKCFSITYRPIFASPDSFWSPLHLEILTGKLFLWLHFLLRRLISPGCLFAVTDLSSASYSSILLVTITWNRRSAECLLHKGNDNRAENFPVNAFTQWLAALYWERRVSIFPMLCLYSMVFIEILHVYRMSHCRLLLLIMSLVIQRRFFQHRAR